MRVESIDAPGPNRTSPEPPSRMHPGKMSKRSPALRKNSTFCPETGGNVEHFGCVGHSVLHFARKPGKTSNGRFRRTLNSTFSPVWVRPPENPAARTQQAEGSRPGAGAGDLTAQELGGGASRGSNLFRIEPVPGGLDWVNSQLTARPRATRAKRRSRESLRQRERSVGWIAPEEGGTAPSGGGIAPPGGTAPSGGGIAPSGGLTPSGGSLRQRNRSVLRNHHVRGTAPSGGLTPSRGIVPSGGIAPSAGTLHQVDRSGGRWDHSVGRWERSIRGDRSIKGTAPS